MQPLNIDFEILVKFVRGELNDSENELIQAILDKDVILQQVVDGILKDFKDSNQIDIIDFVESSYDEFSNTLAEVDAPNLQQDTQSFGEIISLRLKSIKENTINFWKCDPLESTYLLNQTVPIQGQNKIPFFRTIVYHIFLALAVFHLMQIKQTKPIDFVYEASEDYEKHHGSMEGEWVGATKIEPPNKNGKDNSYQSSLSFDYTDYFIQIGSFSRLSNAERAGVDVAHKYINEAKVLWVIKDVKSGLVDYKLVLGPFNSKIEAVEYKNLHNINGKVTWCDKCMVLKIQS